MAESLGFLDSFYFSINSIANKTVQTFVLTGGNFFDDLSVSLFYHHIDPVIGFLVVTRGSFFLCVRIFQCGAPFFADGTYLCKYILAEGTAILYNSISIYLRKMRN